MRYEWLSRAALRDYAGLLVAGGLPALVGVPLFAWMAAAGMSVLWANVLVLAASSMVTFCLGYWVVFAYRDVPLLRALRRFLVVLAATSLADVLVVMALSRLLPREAVFLLLAKACGIAAGLLARLLLMRAWAFAGPLRERLRAAGPL